MQPLNITEAEEDWITFTDRTELNIYAINQYETYRNTFVLVLKEAKKAPSHIKVVLGIFLVSLLLFMLAFGIFRLTRRQNGQPSVAAEV